MNKNFLLLAFVLSPMAQAVSKEDNEKTLKILKERAVNQLSEEEFYEAMLAGIAMKLEEKDYPEKPKTLSWNSGNILLRPEQYGDLKVNLKSEVAGVGLALKFHPENGDKAALVEEVFDGGAKKAGIVVGDQIVKINDKATSDFKSLYELVSVIRGPIGTKVNIVVLRNAELLKFKIERATIKFPSFQSKELDNKILYVRVSYFSRSSGQVVFDELTRVQKKAFKDVIIDFRGNGGGNIDGAEDFIKSFLKKGDTPFGILRSGGKYEMFSVQQEGPAKDFRVVLLVNSETDGSAMYVAKGLQLLGRATIMGEKTGSKGTIQDDIPLKNDFAFMFTFGTMVDGQKKQLHGIGVIPDIIIPSPLKESEFGKGNDFVLATAREILKK